MYIIKLRRSSRTLTVRHINRKVYVRHVGRVGATGPTGSTGPAGADGALGPTGPKGDDGLVTSIVAGENISVDSTDPAHPIVSSLGGGGDVESVNGQTGVVLLDTDDISDASSTNKYVTASEKTKLSNTSGVNTGDQDLSTLVPKTTTVNGHTLSSNVVVTKSDIGLSNVDNTSDSSKPISTVQQTAIDLKVDKTTTVNGHALNSNVTVSKSDVGLSNVDNTSDSNKPISTLQQSALDFKQSLSAKDVANGYAGLDSDGKINSSELPAIAITETFVVVSQAAMLALTAQPGDVAVRTDVSKSFILTASPASTLGNWQELLTPTDAVSSVFGRSGVVTAQSGDYTGLQVTNTPAGSIGSITAQGAINELDTEKQPIDSDLTSIAALSPTNDDIIQRKAGSWTNRTPSQVKTDLSLTKSDVGLGNVDNTSDVTKNSSIATLTNKTLTSPVVNTPTGIVKGDVGLGNVDNTSDATKNAASVTLTNKTLTAPVVNSPTGIVKADVGLGNVDNTSDANKPVSTTQQTAIDAKVIDSIADSDTSHAPSRNSVFDALALKQPLDQDLTDLAALSGVRGDIIYRDATQWQRLAKGTAGFVLQQGANDPSWAASAKPTVTIIVAASGGDYTTLGAAITAASAGDTILVRKGTYTETTITSTLTGITIIGEGRESAIIDLNTTTCTLSGIDVTIKDLRFNISTGKLLGSGNNLNILNVDLVTSGNGQCLSITGTNSKLTNFYYFDGSSSYTTGPKINFASKHGIINSCHFYQMNQAGSVSIGSTSIAADNITVTGNTFRVRTSAASGVHLQTASGTKYATITGNTFLGDNSFSDYAISLLGDQHSVSANTVFGGRGIICNTVTYGAITGNHIRATASSSGRGIMLGTGSNMVVTGNVIFTSQYGVTVESNSDNNVISGNIINGNTYGVYIDSTSCEFNCVTGNNFTGSATAINDGGTATNSFGNIGTPVLNETRFVRMKNTSGSTISQGAVVTYKTVAAGDEITTTTTASDNLVFGVASNSITNNAYGYIQILGKTIVLKVNGVIDIAIGDFLTTFTTVGIARKAAVGTLGTTPGDLAFAIALEAYTTDDSNGVIDALIVSPTRL